MPKPLTTWSMYSTPVATEMFTAGRANGALFGYIEAPTARLGGINVNVTVNIVLAYSRCGQCRSDTGCMSLHPGITPSNCLNNCRHVIESQVHDSSHSLGTVLTPECRSSTTAAHHRVRWSEDMIKADPFFGRSRVRFRVPPWVSNTTARDHLAKHRRRPCELRAVL